MENELFKHLLKEEPIEKLVENYIGTKAEIKEMVRKARRLTYWTALAGLAGAVFWALNSLADLILKFN